ATDSLPKSTPLPRTAKPTTGRGAATPRSWACGRARGHLTRTSPRQSRARAPVAGTMDNRPAQHPIETTRLTRPVMSIQEPKPLRPGRLIALHLHRGQRFVSFEGLFGLHHDRVFV